MWFQGEAETDEQPAVALHDRHTADHYYYSLPAERPHWLTSFFHSLIHSLSLFQNSNSTPLLPTNYTHAPHFYFHHSPSLLLLLASSFFLHYQHGPSFANKVNFGLIEVYPNLNRYIQVFKEVYFTCNNAYINSLEAF